MIQKKKLKLFISYCHLDETDVEKFKDHITPIKNQGLIEDWYDRKLPAGSKFQDDINNNLDDADIICLFISASFLASSSCIKEIERSVDLKNKKGIPVIPIILQKCGWLDVEDISLLLALPQDGNPVSSFTNLNDAWNSVYEALKKVIANENKIKQLEIKDNFLNFLESTELLTQAHSNKETLLLEDIGRLFTRCCLACDRV